MSRYARLKRDVTLFHKTAILSRDKKVSITIPEGTIVKTDHWDNRHSIVIVDSYDNLCRNINLEFLDD